MKNILSVLLASLVLSSCSENKIAEKQTTFCNPMNLDYGWGCFQTKQKKARSAADPVVVLFKGKYYLFTTMILEDIVFQTILLLGRMYISILKYMLLH